MTEHEGFETVDERQKVPVALVVAGIIVIVIAVFVAQNTEEIRFEFLLFDFNAPLWLILVVVFVLGALAGQAATWYRRRRKRRAQEAD